MKLALVCLLLEKDFDMLVAVCTPPYYSWENPMVQIMSTINIVFQSESLIKSSMPEELDKKPFGRNSVKEICEACEVCPELTDALSDSMQTV